MKKLLFISFILMTSFILNAQEKTPHIARVEGNIDLGIVVGTYDTGLGIYGAGNALGAEVRYNFQQMPFDVGVGYVSTRMYRHYSTTAQFFSRNIYAVSDYTFRQMKKTSLFVGIGVGYAYQNVTLPIEIQETPFEEPDGSIGVWSSIYSCGGPRHTVCAIPRVGVEFWHRLRITCSYYFQEKANQRFQFSITCTIGGGVRGKTSK